ncbi:M20 family metallo-hydrolase [Microbacterium sp. PMB16]|uniref:M20 family metallo-hydrolase n=1 Tax=Microbacterium sp. PMB16 TaxID=3120157 RepID=UPI003F4C3096
MHREAASIADGQARTWLTTWLELHDFEVRVDPIGNVFGLRTFVPGAPSVLVGSHLDSQPHAGRFDGAYGVLAAAHAADHVSRLVAAGDLTARFNVAVVDWFNEEGSRFSPSMMGSSVFTGKLSVEDAHETRDASGSSVAESLEAIGFLGTDRSPEVCSYAEIHVEQGKEMAEDGITIGVVESNWAAVKFSVVVTGEQAHTGSTRMHDRRDALYGASLFVARLRQLADEFAAGELHTSVGKLTVTPNSPVVVASRVDLLADVRSLDEELLQVAMARIEEIVAEIEDEANVEFELHESHRWGVQSYPATGVELSEDILGSSPYSFARTVTLAGHDSTNMKDVVPTVMLFVPSEGGISHNEQEYTKDADLIAGVDAIARVTARLVAGDLVDGSAEPFVSPLNDKATQ